jgi:predicted methyltransferase|tara:strand:- start:411 stop:683 length:273 start_codon:yes stop_codon:yes gene_type:complete
MIEEKDAEEVLLHLQKACALVQQNVRKSVSRTNVREIQRAKELQRINSLLVSICDVMKKFNEQEKNNELERETFIREKRKKESSIVGVIL